ncbi:MAG: type II toxin-antitoxin system RelE/ParE family toxin [Salinimicrobium sp.]
MAYRVVISREAEVELGIADCYFRTKDLEKVFWTDFLKQLEFLEKTPLSFQKKYREIRIILFNDFNYSIHYIVEEKTVFILRILNQRQDF